MTDRFALAYLARDARVPRFVPHRYDDAGDRSLAVARAAERSVSPETHACLLRLNAALAPSAARDAHLKALAEPGTVCVVTGQQVGLFLGPLYTLYKAAAAIVTARALEAATGRRTVPVFWLQSEDHDFEEVATTYVPVSGDSPRALTASGESESRVSMAHRWFGPDLASVHDQLTDALGTLPFAPETADLFGRHFHTGAGWVDAFAAMMGALFADEGLVLFNPRTADAAPLGAPVHRRAITEAGRIANALIARREALVDAGFSAPVHVRAGAPLSFFHPDGPEGPRYRIAPTEGEAGWSIVGTGDTVTRDAVLAALERDPGCFSTSALLRPILQDTLLPTAAYVGGPGEIDYFAQLGPLYDAFGLPMPLVVPRARFAVLEPKVRKSLDELGLPLEAFARPEAELLDGVACRPAHLADPERLQEGLLESLRRELGMLTPQLDGLQPGLSKAADRTLESVERACGKFVDKYRAAVNQADTRRVDAVRRVKAALFPLGAPQERVLSLPYFAARHGARAFVARVIEACHPFHPELEALEP